MKLNIRTITAIGTVLAAILAPLSALASQKVAIVVANRADAQLNDQTSVFEDLLVAEVTGLGFDIISRDMVLSAVGDLLSTPQQNELDATMSDQTSALRLSQSLGADYLLVGTILGLDTETRDSSAYGVSVQNNIHTLQTTYRVLDGSTGGSLAAGSISPSRSIQQSANSKISTPGLVRQLLARASQEISAKLKVQKEAGAIRTVEVDKALVGFNVAVSITELNFPKLSGQTTASNGSPATTQPSKPLLSVSRWTESPLGQPVGASFRQHPDCIGSGSAGTTSFPLSAWSTSRTAWTCKSPWN